MKRFYDLTTTRSDETSATYRDIAKVCIDTEIQNDLFDALISSALINLNPSRKTGICRVPDDPSNYNDELTLNTGIRNVLDYHNLAVQWAALVSESVRVCINVTLKSFKNGGEVVKGNYNLIYTTVGSSDRFFKNVEKILLSKNILMNVKFNALKTIEPIPSYNIFDVTLSSFESVDEVIHIFEDAIRICDRECDTSNESKIFITFIDKKKVRNVYVSEMCFPKIPDNEMLAAMRYIYSVIVRFGYECVVNAVCDTIFVTVENLNDAMSDMERRAIVTRFYDLNFITSPIPSMNQLYEDCVSDIERLNREHPNGLLQIHVTYKNIMPNKAKFRTVYCEDVDLLIDEIKKSSPNINAVVYEYCKITGMRYINIITCGTPEFMNEWYESKIKSNYGIVDPVHYSDFVSHLYEKHYGSIRVSGYVMLKDQIVPLNNKPFIIHVDKNEVLGEQCASFCRWTDRFCDDYPFTLLTFEVRDLDPSDFAVDVVMRLQYNKNAGVSLHDSLKRIESDITNYSTIVSIKNAVEKECEKHEYDLTNSIGNEVLKASLVSITDDRKYMFVDEDMKEFFKGSINYYTGIGIKVYFIPGEVIDKINKYFPERETKSTVTIDINISK